MRVRVWVSQGDDLMVDVHGQIGSQMAGLAVGREARSIGDTR